MVKEEFDYNDFTWDMVQSENRFFALHMADKSTIEFVFLDGEVITGKIKWYDELNLGVITDEKEEIYIDKRFLKWIKAL